MSQAIWEQYGGYWGAHPKYPVSDWQYEVENGDTRTGYWEWVESQSEGGNDDEEDETVHLAKDDLMLCGQEEGIYIPIEEGKWNGEVTCQACLAAVERNAHGSNSN